MFVWLNDVLLHIPHVIKLITLIMVRNIILHVCNLSKTFSCAENVLFDTKHDVVAISRF